MKKNILIGVIVLILLFSYPTKLKHKYNNRTNKENAILITVLNGRKFDSDEENSTKISEEFYKKNFIQNPFDIYKNENTIQHSSRNNKGKIMLSYDHYIIPETKLD
ncbi:hypothetical protein [Flavobacterium sp. DSR3-2]|uniref:hypothetical protein n=1 Tax=unclassified Flavobacterium TaxID=196869 RepID=UPI003CF2B94A